MRFALCAFLALVCSTPARAQDAAHAPDVPEPGSVEKIAEYTTAPEYLPSSVAYVPNSETVPSPEEVLGHLVGAPDALSSVAEIHGYFRKLAEASPRVRVERIGMSEEGREILVAMISDEANLDRLDRQSEITARLADPRSLDRAGMEALVPEGRAFYYLFGGLHSTETGSPEMLMELAYRLAVSETPEIRAIRDNVIVLITPVVEPDGRDRTVEWYYRHLRGKKLPFRELDRFSSPPYWGHYAFHDNNRDGMQLTLALTRAINETYFRFHPLVMHDLHESLPLLYISTGHGPYSLAVDPVTVNEWTQFAYHEASELQSMGLPGVWTWGFWDGWWPGYLFSVANNHNSVGRFYETFGNTMPGAFERNLRDERFVGKPVTEVQWYRPWPPEKKLTWSLRDNTNYMEAGVLEALEYAGAHREELLRNFWVKGARAIEKGKTEAPYAWVFSTAQRDPARLAYLLNQLRHHRIEVQRLTGVAAVGDTTYPSGTYVVRMDQPYRNAAVNFLEEQKFPAEEPNAPYDDIAWTWPLLYGVQGARVDDEKILQAGMELVAEDVDTTGTVEGEGPIFLLPDRGQTAFLSARVELGRNAVNAAETTFVHEGKTYPAGSWIVRAPRTVVEHVAGKFGLEFQGTSVAPLVRSHPVDLPRLGVYHTWISTQDCGWVRYTFDHQGIPYTLLNDDDLRGGGLGRRFDVILFPDTWGDLASIVNGIDPKCGPLAYTKTSRYPSHGTPDASNDITGGMGFGGLIHLREFVEEGGILAAISGAGVLPVDAGFVREVRAVSTGSTPGSVLRTKVLRPEHPIAYGYEALPAVFRGNGPLWDVELEDRGRVVLQFGTKDVEKEDKETKGTPASGTTSGGEGSGAARKPGGADAVAAAGGPLVLSGFVKESDKLDGKPAILDLPVGKGRVVLYAMNPLHRYLTHADFRFVYNLILNWNDLPD